MGGKVMLFWLDRNDVRLGFLHAIGPVTHREELRGDDSIEFYCKETPSKYDRILWRDPQGGAWHEHVVVQTTEDMGVEGCKVLARTSLVDAAAIYCEEMRFVLARPRAAVPRFLGELYPDRWNIDIPDYGSVQTLIYHMNGYDALHKIEEDGRIEFESRIDVGDAGVLGRTVVMPEDGRGGYRGLRFTYEKGLSWCRRTVIDTNVYTALYGWGIGLPILNSDGDFTGGYTRRLTMEEALIDLHRNKYGKKYVTDETARQRWGIPVGNKKIHRFGEVVFTDITDPTRLMTATKAALKRVNQPKVVYEANAAYLDGGIDAVLGDKVTVTDTSESPAWVLRCRVVRRERAMSEFGVDTSLDMGTVTPFGAYELEDIVADVTEGENA